MTDSAEWAKARDLDIMRAMREERAAATLTTPQEDPTMITDQADARRYTDAHHAAAAALTHNLVLPITADEPCICPGRGGHTVPACPWYYSVLLVEEAARAARRAAIARL